MNCYPQARVSWSTRTDADQREEAAPVSRHGAGHRRSPAALRSGRGRPPWADPGRRGARRGGARASRRQEERRRRIRGDVADLARGKEGRGRGRPPAEGEEGRGRGGAGQGGEGPGPAAGGSKGGEGLGPVAGGRQ
ncbi:uncharacterized protein [Miscanthus floridulus]|uniref:uncharacterized protein n=1 Tax=Miscanthus floridulus TaxID=154761 RepID=UPI0034591BF2